MKFLPLKAMTLASFLYLPIFTKAQEAVIPEFITNELDSYVEQSLVDWKIPGVAICVVKDGKTIIEKGYGVKQYGKSPRVDANTLFLLGSTSKAFVATALANLAYRGKCSLEDPLKKWLPGFELSDPWVSAHVNLQDFLSHRSGLGRFQGDFVFFDSDLSKSDFYPVLAKMELKNDFRSFGYTNIGYFLIGEAIEAISGNTLSEQLKKDLFNPTRMSHTLSLPSKFLLESNRSTPHTLVNDEVTQRHMGDMETMAAAGGISSSVSDLSYWLKVQLDSGRLDHNSVIPLEVLEMVRKPQILIGKSGPPYTLFNSSNFENYASGWYNLDYQGSEIITHNGGGYGFTSSITLVPEHRLGIAILTNSDEHLLFDALKLEIIDAYLGLPFRNYSKMAQSFYRFRTKQKQEEINQLDQRILLAPNPIIPFAKYSGIYENDLYGKITITTRNGNLYMEFQHHPSLEVKMDFIEEGQFLGTFNQSIYGKVVLPFNIEGDTVNSLVFSVDANVEPHSYVFEKVGN